METFLRFKRKTQRISPLALMTKISNFESAINWIRTRQYLALGQYYRLMKKDNWTERLPFQSDQL
jgi:hypothetical protein